MFSSAKHPVLTGTAILTCAGTLSRLIGFFYRIFLSRTIGAQGLGIYQMIFPVYAFCLSGVTAGIQSALSRCCSAALSRENPRKGWVFFLSGSGLSVGLSLIVSFFLYTPHPGSAFISYMRSDAVNFCSCLLSVCPSVPYTPASMPGTFPPAEPRFRLYHNYWNSLPGWVLLMSFT